MPHCIIEYSSDVNMDSPQEVMSQVHDILVQVGGVQAANIKSRMIPCQDYLVNQGGETFVAFTLKLLPGRSPSLKTQLGKKILKTLQSHMEADKVSVEIIELEKEFYFK